MSASAFPDGSSSLGTHPGGSAHILNQALFRYKGTNCSPLNVKRRSQTAYERERLCRRLELTCAKVSLSTLLCGFLPGPLSLLPAPICWTQYLPLHFFSAERP